MRTEHLVRAALDYFRDLCCSGGSDRELVLETGPRRDPVGASLGFFVKGITVTVAKEVKLDLRPEQIREPIEAAVAEGKHGTEQPSGAGAAPGPHAACVDGRVLDQESPATSSGKRGQVFACGIAHLH